MSGVEITSGMPFVPPNRVPVPDVAGFGGTVRALGRTMGHTCQDPGIILVQSGTAAFVDTLWMFLTIDSGEVLEEYLDPRNARNARKGKRSASGRRRRNRRGDLLWWRSLSRGNLNGAVAAIIPGKRLIRALGLVPGVGAFFRIFNILELGLFTYLLFEAADNFVTKWYSGLYQAQYCTMKTPGLFFWEKHYDASLQSGSSTTQLWNTSLDANPEINEGWGVSAFSTVNAGVDFTAFNALIQFSINNGLYIKEKLVEEMRFGVGVRVTDKWGNVTQKSETILELDIDDPNAGTIPGGGISFSVKQAVKIEFTLVTVCSGPTNDGGSWEGRVNAVITPAGGQPFES